MFEECLDQVATTVNLDIRTFRLFKFFDVTDTFKKNTVFPICFIHGHSLGHNEFCDVIDAWPKVPVCRPERSKRFEGFSAQKKICRLHVFFHELPSPFVCFVEIWRTPTAILETTRSVPNPTRCLQDSI